MKPTRRLPSLLKEKTSERVYPKTLVVAALTAVTLAFISAKLTGVVNSILLVAMASILTAVISETYRLALEGAQVLLARSVARSLDEQAEALTGEIPAVSLEEALVQEQERQANEPAETGTGEAGQHSLPWLFFHRVFVSRWAVPFVFGVVALGTVGASYLIGQVNSEPSYNVVKEITNTQDISRSKVERLERGAEEAAQEAAESEAATAEANAEATTAETREELLTRIESLETSLAEAQATIDDLEASGADASALQSLITDLTGELEALTVRVEALEEPDEPTPPDPTEEPVP